MFQIIGAMAEFEPALVQERVRGRVAECTRQRKATWEAPRVIVDARQIASLRAQGRSWSQIRDETGVSKGTAQGAFVSLPKIAC